MRLRCQTMIYGDSRWLYIFYTTQRHTVLIHIVYDFTGSHTTVVLLILGISCIPILTLNTKAI